MLLTVDGPQGPTVRRVGSQALSGIQGAGLITRHECIHVGLINNMPDAALEDTELQFSDLLDAASSGLLVRLKLFSLPGIPRGDQAQRRLDRLYFDLSSLCSSQLDALIITGAEPTQPELRQESYWPALTRVLDWAEENTASTVLSCLAAHAGVLHGDGIERRALASKQCGVFESRKTMNHPLTGGAVGPLRFPHSRWNEAPGSELMSHGYSILSRSEEAGVDLFVKKRKRSLFVYFQGHPEYSALSLFKEYRRDVRRFLKRERRAYPSMPQGYFELEARQVLDDFRMCAVDRPTEESMALFPEAAVVPTLRNIWRPTAASIYRNWLRYLASRTANARICAARSQARLGGSIPVPNQTAEEPVHVL